MGGFCPRDSAGSSVVFESEAADSLQSVHMVQHVASFVVMAQLSFTLRAFNSSSSEKKARFVSME